MSALRAISPQEAVNYQRVHQLLGNDLLEFFTYVEPADLNLTVFGHRSYQLFLRICTEFESACKTAVKRSGISTTFLDKSGRVKSESRWDITDYAKLNELDLPVRKNNGCSGLNLKRGKLSDYQFSLFNWRNAKTFKPLLQFQNSETLSFYQRYNKVKHNREEQFEEANLDNLVNSYLALTAVLDWQDISINQTVITDCENESFFGAKFGYFWVTNSSVPTTSEKIYF